MGTPEQLRVRLLGGLDIEGLDERAIGSRKARTLVKILALGRGAPVSADAVVEALWPSDDVPAKPMEQIGVLVSRLRAVLGSERLVRSDAGWALTVDWLDIVELEERVEEAAARLAAGQPDGGAGRRRAALALVRGEFLADEPDPCGPRPIVSPSHDPWLAPDSWPRTPRWPAAIPATPRRWPKAHSITTRTTRPRCAR